MKAVPYLDLIILATGGISTVHLSRETYSGTANVEYTSPAEFEEMPYPWLSGYHNELLLCCG